MFKFITLFFCLFSTVGFAQEAVSGEKSGQATAKPKVDSTITTVAEFATPVKKGDYATEHYEGTRDAQTFYKGYKGAGTGTLVVSLLSPLVGLIPAIACSSTPPTEVNLGYPNAERFKQTNYRNGYRQEAKKIKSRKVWTNWGIAFGANLLAVLLISSK